MQEAIRSCPRCHVPMEKAAMLEVTVDRCERCSGEFYDAGELEASATSYRPEELTTRLSREISRREAVPSKIACPACDGTMEKLEARGAEIDRCRRCKGLWLDDGEPERMRSLVKALASSSRDVKVDWEHDTGSEKLWRAAWWADVLSIFVRW